MTQTRVVHAGSAEFRNDPTAVYIGRACRRAADPRCHVESKWHNPFVYSPTQGFRELLPDQAVTYLIGARARGKDIYVKLAHRPDVLRAFAIYAKWRWWEAYDELRSLEGKLLGCWCKRRGDEPCHGDVLVKLIEHWRRIPW